MVDITKKIRDIIRFKGLTKGEFAASIGLKPATFSHYLTGKRKISKEVLDNIVYIHNINPSYFFNEDAPMFGDYEVEFPHSHTYEEELTTLPVYQLHNLIKENPRPLAFRKAALTGYGEGEYYYGIARDSTMITTGILKDTVVLIKKQDHFDSGDVLLMSINLQIPVIRRIILKDSFVFIYAEGFQLNHHFMTEEEFSNQTMIYGKVLEAYTKI